VEAEGTLINWGPRTAESSVQPQSGLSVFKIGTLTLQQRRTLEAIAWNIGVTDPDGEFNCQNWVAAVLNAAVLRGLFTAAEVGNALKLALQEDLGGKFIWMVQLNRLFYN
jgi:hypothetical protein